MCTSVEQTCYYYIETETDFHFSRLYQMKLPQNIRCQCIVCIEQKFTHCVRVPKSRYYRRQFHRTRQIRRKKLHAGGFKKVLPKLANVTRFAYLHSNAWRSFIFEICRQPTCHWNRSYMELRSRQFHEMPMDVALMKTI